MARTIVPTNIFGFGTQQPLQQTPSFTTTAPNNPLLSNPSIAAAAATNFSNNAAAANAAQNAAIQQAQVDRLVEERAQVIANQIVQAQAAQSQLVKNSGRVFSRFNIADDVIENQKTVVTRGLFGGEASMSIIFSSSAQTATQKQYYYDCKDTSTSYFSVAYGHRLGSGSDADGTNNDSPNRAVYSQYRLLLLEPGDTTFTFDSGRSNRTSDHIYVVNLNRSAVKEKLDPGNWQL